MADLAGAMLGKYQVLERLGRGGMGDVYKGYHARLDRHVAIKVLHPHLIDDREFLPRFEREAQAVASLRHPNIIQLYDFDKENGTYYMVMEYVDGGSLKTEKEKLDQANEFMRFAQVASLMRQIGSALDYAHELGMVHRDVKPSNILLDSSGIAYLSDFGIVRIFSGSQFTVTGTLIGTPGYMSPEQGKGQELTPVSDMYSLGVILYELLAGSVPFDADTPLAIIHKHISEPLPPPRDHRPDLPVEIENVVVKAMAKEPAERFQKAKDLSAALNLAIAASEGKPVVEEIEDQLEVQPLEAQGEAPPGEMLTEIAPSAPSDFVRPDLELLSVDETEESTLQEDAKEDLFPVEAELIPHQTTAQPVDALEEEVVSVTTEEDVEAEEIAPAPVYEQEELEDLPDGLPDVTPKEKKIRRIKPVYIIASAAVITAIIGLIVIVSLIVPILGQVFNSDGCQTIDECLAQKNEYMEAEEWDLAVDKIDETLELIPDERPPFAYLWCERGSAKAEMEEIDEAISSFEHCMEWTEGDPGLEHLRAGAEEYIHHLLEIREQQ